MEDIGFLDEGRFFKDWEGGKFIDGGGEYFKKTFFF